MRLNKAKGNMYEWVTHTWGVGRGCAHQCEYCYVKQPRFHREQPKTFTLDSVFPPLGQGRTIFVGHMTDLFASGVHGDEIKAVLHHCAKYRNTYVFQTKNPARLADYMETITALSLDIIAGTTIETNRQALLDKYSSAPVAQSRACGLGALSCQKFLTVEPIMKFDLEQLVRLVMLAQPEWVNIGADSKGRNLPEPTWGEVMALADALRASGIEIREKYNIERLKGGEE